MSKAQDSKARDHVATFVAAPGVALAEAQLCESLAAAGVAAARFDWLDPGRAVDAFFALVPDEAPRVAADLRAGLAGGRIDSILQPAATRRKALLVADMDSTMIGQECIDELAEALGIRDSIAAVTEQAMRGEIEFDGALRARVALLAGLRLETLDDILATRITPMAGARELVATMRADGAYTALVSGGFTLFTGPVGARLGFHEARANSLVIEAGALSGRVVEPILGRAAKRAALEEIAAARGLRPEDALAVGDGANDLDMLSAAGLGVAFHAKPKVAAVAGARVDFTDLTTLLFAQGYRRTQFVTEF